MGNAGASSEHIIVDSHHHFWDLARFDYPMAPGEGVLGRNYLPEDLAPVLERNGVSGTVLVQAHQSVGEARWLLDLAEANDFVAGVVAWVDLLSPDVGDVLDALMERRKLVGVRHGVEDDPDQAWLTRDAAVRGLKELEARGLRYDLLTRPHQLRYVPSLAEKAPDLRMVVDHISKPPIASGEMEPWATEIAEVAAIPGVYCKLSGMVTEADHALWKPDDLRPYVSHVAEVFGMDRLMFGSDWPVCLLAAGYDDVLRAALEALGPVSDDDPARLLGRNAIEFYGLEV